MSSIQQITTGEQEDESSSMGFDRISKSGTSSHYSKGKKAHNDHVKKFENEK